jgi:hypothetical protein
MRIGAGRIDGADMGRSGAAPVHGSGERIDRGGEGKFCTLNNAGCDT